MGIYKLDSIYIGDARELSKGIPDESVDLVLNDPPFGINFDYKGTNYKDDPLLYHDMIQWVVKESNRIVKPGGLCFVFVAQPQLRSIWPLFPEDSRIFAACKNFVQIRNIPVQYSYDPAIFWIKDGPRLKDCTGRDFYVANTANTSNRGVANAGFHPCPSPLSTIIYIVDNFCPREGIVCDFFIGSGTTGVAAKLVGTRYLGFEISPNYVKLALQRISHILPLSPKPEVIQESMTL